MTNDPHALAIIHAQQAHSPRPFPRSYWVTPGKLLAGHFPGDADYQVGRQKLKNLLDCGIRRVVNLMEADEVDHHGNLFMPYADILPRLAEPLGIAVTCLRFPIHDLDIPNRDRMKAILDAIDAGERTGEPTYVHCWGGIGRTGTVVGCYMIRRHIALGTEVFHHSQRLRRSDPKAYRSSPETEAQREFVLSWKPGE